MTRYAVLAMISAICVSFAAERAVAKPPSPVLAELKGVKNATVFTRVDQLPLAIRQALAKTFGQRRLSLADANTHFRETDVIMPGEEDLPFRRLRFAFATPSFFVVHYEHGGMGFSADTLVFSYRSSGPAKLVWGGADADFRAARSPSELIRRIREGKAMDDEKYIW